jgi:hypothetical protein
LTKRSADAAIVGAKRGSETVDDSSTESSSEVQNLQPLGDDEQGLTRTHAREANGADFSDADCDWYANTEFGEAR